MSRKPTTNTQPEVTFEEMRAKLRETTLQLEQGDLPLETAITVYEEGMRMYAACNLMLDQAELRVQVVQANSDGTSSLQDIEIITE